MATERNARLTAISLVIPILYAIWGFVIYSPALGGPFYLDDGDNITNNPAIRDLSNFLDFSGTRYLSYLSFALNYALGGLSTYGFRLTNVAIHAVNAILVYRLVLLLGRTPLVIARGNVSGVFGMAIISSLLFLTHPLQTQAVSYITQRFASLATFFFLLSVVLYLGARLSRGGPSAYARYGLAFLFAVAAMKTKEISFTLPFVLVLFELAFFSPEGRAKARLLYLAPFFATLTIVPLSLYGPFAAVGVGEETVQSILRESQLTDLAVIPRYNYFISEFYVILVYIKLFFFPSGLHLFYDYKYSLALDAKVLSSFAVLSVIFAASVFFFIRSLRRGGVFGIIASAGLMWFFITLSVESSVIPIQHLIFEHRTYLPGVGFFIFLGACIARAVGDKKAVVVAAALALVLSALSYSRNMEWGDPVKFHQNEVRQNPHVPSRHNDLGFAYMNAGRDDEAIAALKKSLELSPDFAVSLSTLAAIYLNRGQYAEAEPLLIHAMEVEPDYLDTRYNLATVYINTRRFSDAIPLYRGVLAVLYAEPLQDRQFTSDVHLNLGNAYMATGEAALAINEYENALRMNPDNALARQNLERALIFSNRR